MLAMPKLSAMPNATPDPTLPAEPDRLYRAVTQRDPTFDGLFFTCVKTTGIFCRPVCTARTPKRENVEFMRTAQQAMLAGYRPCKICRPTEPPTDAPPWLPELLEEIRTGKAIRERQVRERGLDPDHVRRVFKKHVGMSLAAYQRSLRLGDALGSIRKGGAATRAALDAGYESDSGFRDAFERLFGVPPSRAKHTQHLTAGWLTSPLGPLLTVASDEGLCMLEFIDRRSIETQIEAVRRRTKLPVIPGEHSILAQTKQEMAEYFAGTRQHFDVKLAPQGTDFERAVWQRLLKIPYAETCSYSRMAKDIEKPGAARAIGRANGANRIAIIIPCHRVIRADGALCGYGGGVHRKQWLLDHERKNAGLFA